jgi:hypothetical protein
MFHTEAMWNSRTRSETVEPCVTCKWPEPNSTQETLWGYTSQPTGTTERGIKGAPLYTTLIGRRACTPIWSVVGLAHFAFSRSIMLFLIFFSFLFFLHFLKF